MGLFLVPCAVLGAGMSYFALYLLRFYITYSFPTFSTVCAEKDKLLSRIDHCFKVSALLLTHQEALESPESENWKTTTRDKMNSIIENNKFTLTTLIEGRNSAERALGIHSQRGF